MKPATNTPHDWSEDKLQGEFYMWFHNTFPMHRGLLFAVPNGGLRDAITARKMKATGTVAGVADMIFLWDRRTYLLELKRPDGKGYQSDKQTRFEARVKEQGFSYKLFNDLKELKTFVLSIMTTDKTDKDNYPHKQAQLFSWKKRD